MNNDSIWIADQIFMIGKLLKQYTELALKAYGLGSGQLQILMVIYQSEGTVTQANLVKSLGIDKANVSRNLGKLVSRGYVQRSDKSVVLTELGSALKPELVAFLQKTHHLMVNGIDEAQLKSTSDALRVMIAQLEKGVASHA